MPRLTVSELHAKLRSITTAVQRLSEGPGVPFLHKELFEKKSAWQRPFLEKLIVQKLITKTSQPGKLFGAGSLQYLPVDIEGLKKLASDQVALAKLVQMDVKMLELPVIEKDPWVEGIQNREMETIPPASEIEPEPTKAEQMQFVTVQNVVYMREKIDLLEKKLNKLLKALGEEP